MTDCGQCNVNNSISGDPDYFSLGCKTGPFSDDFSFRGALTSFPEVCSVR